MSVCRGAAQGAWARVGASAGRPVFAPQLGDLTCARRAAASCSAQLGSSCSARVLSTTAVLRAPLRASTPSFQAKKPAKGGAGPAAVVENFDLKKQIPVNILKEGPEPEYKADSEYPPWLFDLLAEKVPVEETMMKGVENMTPGEMKAVIRTVSKRRIKEANMASAKATEE